LTPTTTPPPPTVTSTPTATPTPGPPLIFSDGFESGDLSAWSVGYTLRVLRITG
jgi:hypothetical protein